MLHQAKIKRKKKRGEILHSFRNVSKEVMGVAAASFGVGESLEQEICGMSPGKLTEKKARKRKI